MRSTVLVFITFWFLYGIESRVLAYTGEGCDYSAWHKVQNVPSSAIALTISWIENTLAVVERGDMDLAMELVDRAAAEVHGYQDANDILTVAPFLTRHLTLAGQGRLSQAFLRGVVDRSIPIDLPGSLYGTGRLGAILRVNALRAATDPAAALATLKRIEAEVSRKPLCAEMRVLAEIDIAREYLLWADPAIGGERLDQLARRATGLPLVDPVGLPIRSMALRAVAEVALEAGASDRVRRYVRLSEAEAGRLRDIPGFPKDDLQDVRDGIAYLRQELGD